MYHCLVNLSAFPCIVWDISQAHTYHSLTRARYLSLSSTHTFTLTLILTISASHTQHTFTQTHTHTFISIVYRDAEAGWLDRHQSLLCVRSSSFVGRNYTSLKEPASLYIPLQPSSPFLFLANSSVSSVCSVSACTANTEE